MAHIRYVFSIFLIVFLIIGAQQTQAEEIEGGSTSASPGGGLPRWIEPYYPPYKSTNKSDPFVSFVKVRAYERLEAAKRAKAQKKVSTPLETVEVNALKVIGIINKLNEQPIAMVEMPDGKGYIIRPGMIVGLYDGVVKEIENSTVVVEENVMDIFGEPKKRTINLRLRQD